MTLKKINTVRAGQLRSLARAFEQGTKEGFTCLHVEDALGADVRRAYEQAYEFGTICVTSENDHELWSMDDLTRRERRILLLCFAAAMAETGDL